MLSIDDVINYITSKEFEDMIPEGMSVSIPLFEISDDNTVESVFVYSEDMHKCICSRPSMKINFDTVDRKMVDFCNYCDAPEKLKDVPSNTDIHFTAVSDTEKYIAACDIFQNTYGRIREFVFRDVITPNEKAMLVSFVKSLFEMLPSELKIVYGAVFFNFFDWVNKVIIK